MNDIAGHSEEWADGSPIIDCVVVCNTPMHVMNALEALRTWGVKPSQAALIVQALPETDHFELHERVIGLEPWGEIHKILFQPQLPSDFVGMLIGLRSQWRFHRHWMRSIQHLKAKRWVFSPLNRLRANRWIVNYLAPRELVWLDDGTLSDELCRKSLLGKASKKVLGKRRSVNRNNTGRKSPSMERRLGRLE